MKTEPMPLDELVSLVMSERAGINLKHESESLRDRARDYVETFAKNIKEMEKSIRKAKPKKVPV